MSYRNWPHRGHVAADYREATALGQSEFGGNEFLIRSGGEFVDG